MSHGTNPAEKIKEISGTNPLKCMKCGKCSATCPSFDEMDICSFLMYKTETLKL